MKVGVYNINAAQIDAAKLSGTQREQLVARLKSTNVRPQDIDAKQLTAAGVAEAHLPAVLFQLRCAALGPEAELAQKNTTEVLAALVERGLWGDAGSSGNMTYDNCIVQAATALARVVHESEAKGAVGQVEKGHLDDLVEALLATRPPDAVMARDVPDLTKLTDPRVVAHDTGRNSRVAIAQGGDPNPVLTLFTYHGSYFVEAGAASGCFSGGMVATGYLDHATTLRLIEVVDKAIERESAKASDRQHPAMAAVIDADSARGLLAVMRCNLVEHAEELVRTQTANAKAIEALDARLVTGPKETWFATERLGVPVTSQGWDNPGGVEKDPQSGRLLAIVPEGAELWAEGRHPAEVIRSSPCSGLFVRHEGQVYMTEWHEYRDSGGQRASHLALSEVPDHLYARYRVPAHWRAAPAANPATASTYPKNAFHDVIKVGLEGFTKPVVSQLDDVGAPTLTVAQESGTDHASIRIRESAPGEFKLLGWRLEAGTLVTYDRDTLMRLESFGRAVAQAAKGKAERDFATRFVQAVSSERVARESNAETQAMQGYVSAGLDYKVEHLRALMAQGVSPEQLKVVEANAKQTSDANDPKVFAARCAELAFPERVVVDAAQIDAAIAAGLGDTSDWFAAHAAIASALRGASAEERAALTTRAASWTQRQDWPSLRYHALIAQALLGDEGVAKAAFLAGKAQSGSDYRKPLTAAWGVMAAAARGPEQRREAHQLITKYIDTDYLDMIGSVLPAAALVANSAGRAELAARIDKNLGSDYWAISSGGILAKGLCAETDAEKTAAFEHARTELDRTNNRRIIICALTAMALTAVSPEQVAVTLAKAREYTFKKWCDELRAGALVAMGIVTSKDPVAKRRAAMASLDV